MVGRCSPLPRSLFPTGWGKPTEDITILKHGKNTLIIRNEASSVHGRWAIK